MMITHLKTTLKRRSEHSLPAENDADFRALTTKYQQILSPADAWESELVGDIVLAQHRLHRARAIEDTLLHSACRLLAANYDAPAKSPRALRAFGFLRLAENSKVLPILHRLQESLSRQYNTAMQSLILYRKSMAPGPIPTVQAKRKAPKSGRTLASVTAIDDPRFGRKPSQPSSCPPEPETAPEQQAA